MDEKREKELFQTNPESLKGLMYEIENGNLAVPEFQRSFIWPPEHTASLLSSIIADYPAGSLLTWRPEKIELEPRAIDKAPKLKRPPERLILDGQQRLTALYRATRKGKSDETYFLQLDELLDRTAFRLKDPNSINWDSVVTVRNLTATERRNLKLKTPKHPEHRSKEWQYKNFSFPMYEDFEEWSIGLEQLGAEHEEQAVRRAAFKSIRKQYLEKLDNYKFPVVTLSSVATLAAVCSVFEKLNTNSVRLGPFEILTAKFFKDDISLRKLWDEARGKYEVLRDPSDENDYRGFSINPYMVLQIITLVEYKSPQRKAVLESLTASDVAKRWDNVVLALKQVIDWLQKNCGIVHRDLLPYQAVLVPLTGAWIERDSLDASKKAYALDKIQRYFWSSVFTTNFDQGAASQSEKDYRDLVEWLRDAKKNGKSVLPEAVGEIAITADSLFSATVKKKALLQGLMALTVTAGAEDFFTGLSLDPITYVESRVQSHHLYPQGSLDNQKSSHYIPSGGYSTELILNRALIGADTNKRIGAAKPSVYVGLMKDARADIEKILDSHIVNGSALVADSYPAFIKSRLASVVALVEKVTGKKVDALTVEGDGSADDQPAVG